MTTQEFYNTVREHFSQFGAQLAKDGQGCFYRGDSGGHDASDSRRCAIGAAIPDAMYVPEMECGLVATLLNQFPVVEGYLWDVDNTFMSRAQVLHDSHASDATNFVVMLDLLAKEFGLTHPEGHFTPAYLTGYR